MKNKLVAFLIIMSMLCTSLSIGVFAEDTTEGTAKVTAVEVLATEEFNIAVALNIISGDAKPDSFVTRGAAAKSITRLLNLQEVQISSLTFEDVSTSSDYYNAVGVVSSNGIMLGDSNNAFRPDDNISMPELATVLVRGIGYDAVARQKGGYPNGYLSQAAALKIFSGVSVDSNAEISLNDFAKILYNMFDVKIMSLESLPGNGNYEITDSTVLNLMNIVELKGVVTKNHKTGLYAAGNFSKGHVLIGNIEVISGETKLLDMLGYGVRVFAEDTEDDDERVAYYAAEYKTEVTQVEFKDLDTSYDIFKNSGAKYNNENGRTETKRFSGNYAVIYNDIAASFRTMSLITDNEGYLTLIDNDSDGKTDVVFIYAYKDYVVDSVNSEKRLISDKFGKMLDLDDVEDDEMIITDINNNEKTLADLSEWDVLSVFDSYVDGKTNSGKRFIKILLSQETISGTLSSVSEDGGYKVIEIDDEQYYVSPFYIAGSKVSQLETGVDGNFYLNAMGKVCAYKLGSLAMLEKQYGVLVAASLGKGLSDEVQYKIFTSTGEWITPKGAERIEIDGDGKKGADRYNCLLNETKIKRQIIKYKLNENEEISYIDTAVQGSSERTDSIKKIYSMDKPALFFRQLAQWFGKKVVLNATTVIFSTPSEEDDYDTYRIAKSGDIEALMSYSMDAYAEYSNLLRPTAIMINDAFKSKFDARYLYIYTGKSIVLVDDEQLYKYKLFGGKEANEVSEYAPIDASKIECIDFNSIDELHEGDIINYSKNAKGQISGVRRIYDYEGKIQSYPVYSISHARRIITARVFEQSDEMASLSLDEITSETTSDQLEIINASKYKIFVYNTTTKKARLGTIADILDYKTYGDKCSTVVISEEDGTPRSMIVYED